MSARTGRWATVRRWLPDAAAVGFVLVLLLVKCWNLVRPWDREYRGGDFAVTIEPHFYHWLKRGVVLLWDPTIGTGSWLLGGGTHPRFPVISILHLFYPLNVVWLGLAERGESISYEAFFGLHLFHYALAAGATYWYGRVLGLERFPATVSSIAFVFSGFMLAHFSHFTFIGTVVWLPAILACVLRADQTGEWRWAAAGGAALGVAVLAGAPQFGLYGALTASGLALLLVGRRIAGGQPWRPLALAYLLVPLVAIGVAAVQLLPSWSVATGSHRAGLGFDWKAQGSLPIVALFQLGLPRVLRPLGSWLNDETYFYPGVLVAILAGFAVSLRWDWRIGFHAVVGFVSLLMAFGLHFTVYRVVFDVVPGFAFFRIPARIMVLFNLSAAVLAGVGAQALLSGREARGLGRFVRWAAVLAAAAAPAMYLLLLWSPERTLARAVEILVDEYVLLLLVLLLVLAAVAWQARGASPRLVRAAVIAALVLDLVFGSLPINGGPNDPDREADAATDLARFVADRPEPVRVNLSGRLDSRVIYRYGLSVVDGESTFAPSRFLDLYFLSADNPKLLDLMNVRYFANVRSHPLPEAGDQFVLPPGAVRRIALPSPVPVRIVEIDSRLIAGREVPDGTTVAVVHAVSDAGDKHVLAIRAGHETAEWTMDRHGDGVAHRRPPIARSWPVANEGYEGHSYRAAFTLPPGFRLAQLVFERAATESWLDIDEVRLDGKVSVQRRSYRQIRPDLVENDAALPRAFLVRRARRVPRFRLLDELKYLDPREEALLSDNLPPGAALAQTPLGEPLPPVKVAEYTPHRVRLETVVGEPALLVLSDTDDRGWRAWDNGRPVPILRTNHALRGVYLTPGSHVVEFRYRQPAFWVGLGISGATWLALLVGGVWAWRRRPRAAVASSVSTRDPP